MDQFIQQRYTDEINVDTGEKIVDWVRFEEIKPLFDKAMRLGTPEVPQEWVHDAEEYFRRLEERDLKLFPAVKGKTCNILVSERIKDGYATWGLDTAVYIIAHTLSRTR